MLRPKCFSDLSTKRVVIRITHTRQGQHLPFLAVLLKQRTGEVGLVPSGENNNDRRARMQTGVDGRFPFCLELAAIGFRFSFFAVFDRVVNDQQVSTFTCDAAANADRDHTAAVSFKIPSNL